jgi:hypothetical protein
MRKELQEVVKDTAAVGLSAAALGMEIGSKIARRTLDEVSRAGDDAAHAPAASELTEKDVSVRAYQLWEQAGCPEGRDKEFYFQAEKELTGEQALGLPAARPAP